MAHGGLVGSITHPIASAWKSISPDVMAGIGTVVGGYFGYPALGAMAGSAAAGGSTQQTLQWGAGVAGVGAGLEAYDAYGAGTAASSGGAGAGPVSPQGASDAYLLGETGSAPSYWPVTTPPPAATPPAAAPTLMQQIGQGINLGTSGYGLYAGAQMVQAQRRQQAMREAQAAQQARYRTQLAELEKNPSSIVNLPGYQAGLDAVQRRMASQGFLGSGNMLAELANYGQGVYNQQYQNLMQLSGAQYSPSAYGGEFDPAGYQLIGQSLNRLGTTAQAAGF